MAPATFRSLCKNTLSPSLYTYAHMCIANIYTQPDSITLLSIHCFCLHSYVKLDADKFVC